ncbi:MAG: SGNH/GDSL hydrolase family protein [Opitutaceae bacterium]|nr:SGNH/GDSL hydrolase family protein [Opitutaceae bacterium]
MPRPRPRFGFAVSLLLLGALGVGRAAAAAPPPPEPVLRWHDVREWPVEGRAWPEQPRQSWFDRLPASAEAAVSANIWRLSHDTAGMLVRFRTDATVLWVDYTLRLDRLSPVYSTAIGASGVDLYARDGGGKLRWVSVSRPEGRVVRQQLFSDPRPGLHEYVLYLPLYNGVERCVIGVPPTATIEPVAPPAAKPIVVYGTSITQGAGASRPGMVYPAILGRRLERPVVNLGFSGNGKLDLALGDLMAQIDAAVYLIDCLPNLTAAEVRAKCGPFVRRLRAARPETPIVLAEDRRWTNSWFIPRYDDEHSDNHAALRECYAALQAEGITGLHYIPGDALYGDDAEASVDGSHPSDLGSFRQAAVFEPVLRAALGQ